MNMNHLIQTHGQKQCHADQQFRENGQFNKQCKDQIISHTHT